MYVSNLSRFINSISGPIISITSTPYPSYLRRYFWHSTALLHENIFLTDNFKFLKTCGGGWSIDKLTSQIKAIVEGIERWAYFYYLKNTPKDARLDIDGSTTGFAALPADFSEKKLILNSYSEAVERWFLSFLWENEKTKFKELSVKDKRVMKMFSNFQGKLHCYTSKILSNLQIYNGYLSVYISAFRLNNGGVIIGSSCGVDENSLYHSIFELFIHCLAYKRMKDKDIRKVSEIENIIERRLFNFAVDDNGFNKLLGRIRLVNEPKAIKHPKILFQKFLKGPWEPEVKVSRVVLEGINEFTSDNENKLVL